MCSLISIDKLLLTILFLISARAVLAKHFSPSWSGLNTDKTLYKYQHTLLNPTFLTFLANCNPRNYSDDTTTQFLCSRYYDAVLQLNETNPNLAINETIIKGVLNNTIDQKPTKFCHKNSFPIASHYLSSAKPKNLNDEIKCIRYCTDEEGDKDVLKAICMVLSWLGNQIAIAKNNVNVSVAVSSKRNTTVIADSSEKNLEIDNIGVSAGTNLTILQNESEGTIKSITNTTISKGVTENIKGSINGKNVELGTPVIPEEINDTRKQIEFIGDNGNDQDEKSYNKNDDQYVAVEEDDEGQLPDVILKNQEESTSLKIKQIKLRNPNQDQSEQQISIKGFITTGKTNNLPNPREDPFVEETGSNFFTYFLLGMFICIAGYVVYHNKSKILALLLEGRRNQKTRGVRRKHTATYMKLDSNLEEAITSSVSGRTSQIIY